MATIYNLSAPPGWNKWVYPKTTAPEDTQLPDASFPVIYTPASAFWLRSEIDHCLIPWINVLDPLSAFFIAGGSSSTIVGSVSALATVGILYPLFVASGTWSAFGPYVGPRFGYCIDNKFKQEAYVRFDIMNGGGVQIILLNAGIELLENSRFKRIYVQQGEVAGFKTINDKYLLTLDINNLNSPPEDQSGIIGTKITITKSNGKSFSLTILGVTSNWDFVVSKPSDIFPSAGDFYELNTVLCIENPYLISGFLKGTENELSGFAASGLNLFVSEHNSPFQKSQFLGVYIDKNKETNAIVPAVYGSNMRDYGDDEWCFYGFGNSKDISQTYKNDTRYKEVILPDPDGEGSIVEYQPRKTASKADYDTLKSNTDFIRVEINTGGYRTRHNWQSPCLLGSYVKVAGKLYKIIGHVGFNIIDVSIKSVDGSSTFDPASNRDYSILNQYAWMINENYFTETDSSRSALFEGVVKAVSSSKIKLETRDPVILGKIKNGFSLADRYKKQIGSTATQSTSTLSTSLPFPSTMKKFFSEKQNWKLISGSQEGNITSIAFGNPDSAGKYIIDINVSNMSLSVGDDCYVTFDRPFKTISGKYTSKGGYSFELSVAGGFVGSKGDSSGYVVSNVLCLNGEFFSFPIFTDIPVDSRIGVCDGYLFGIAGNGSAQDWEGVFMLATTPLTARGVASLFHTLRQEGWVTYKDPVTNKITTRRGSEDFKEYPMKNMVVIGENAYKDKSSGGATIALDTTQEWLKRIEYATPISSDHGIMFATGNIDNMYGFYVSGDGIVDLQLLQKQGQVAGNVPSSTYTSEQGYPVSPVYAYTQEYYQQTKNYIVDIGIKATDGPIYIKDTPISSVIATYVDDNQTIENAGYFDIVRLPHGETILLYDQPISEFKIDNYENNSNATGSNVWSVARAVMCLGTYDDSYNWASPLAGRMDDAKHEDQYPIMLLNAVSYLSCVFDPLSKILEVFCRCIDKDGEPFVGCFIVSVGNLRNNLVIAHHPDFVPGQPQKTPISFLWRPPSISPYQMQNNDKSWTPIGNIVKDGLPEQTTFTDGFVRVIGSEKTKSQVSYADEVGIISTHLFPNGMQALLYDGQGGIQAIFSNNSGRTWRQCNLIYARNARAGVVVGRYLFYITSSGIEVKQTNLTDFYNGMDLSLAGNSTQNTEIQIGIQSTLDELEYSLIGSGSIDPQRLSGYITHDGVIKIFFYDNNNLLKCMDSKDGLKWKVADNF